LIQAWTVAALALISFAGEAFDAPRPSPPATAPGFEMSIQEGAQLNLGALGIGLAYAGSDPYLDGSGVRRDGLHARIAIAIHHKPALYQVPDVREGESVTVGDYRILMERIFPGRPRGDVIVRVWKKSS